MSHLRFRDAPFSTAGQRALLFGLAIVLANVNALVDRVVHPEIPYFDTEHLLVGAITGAVSVGMSLVLLWNNTRLGRARKRVRELEAILPICASCKKIRKPHTDPAAPESWQSVDVYIREQTRSKVSHGICPECSAALYPDDQEDPPAR